MQGTRCANFDDAKQQDGEGKPDGYIPGTYWPGRVLDDGFVEWWIVDPTGYLGSLGRGHTVTEHDDGTITVSPSILSTVEDHGHDWHGYLERGVWRAV